MSMAWLLSPERPQAARPNGLATCATASCLSQPQCRRQPVPEVHSSSTPTAPARGPKLSKDAYRRQREAIDAELTRLGLRKNHLELAVGDPAVRANFVELRRITSELADVEAALVVAEDAWLALEERAP